LIEKGNAEQSEKENEEKGEKMMESYSKLTRPLLKARSRGEGGK